MMKQRYGSPAGRGPRKVVDGTYWIGTELNGFETRNIMRTVQAI